MTILNTTNKVHSAQSNFSPRGESSTQNSLIKRIIDFIMNFFKSNLNNPQSNNIQENPQQLFRNLREVLSPRNFNDDGTLKTVLAKKPSAKTPTKPGKKSVATKTKTSTEIAQKKPAPTRETPKIQKAFNLGNIQNYFTLEERKIADNIELIITRLLAQTENTKSYDSLQKALQAQFDGIKRPVIKAALTKRSLKRLTEN